MCRNRNARHARAGVSLRGGAGSASTTRTVSQPSNALKAGRHAGLLLPLFSAASRESWGIGEIWDMPLLCAWLKDAGMDFLQLLPLNEMTCDQHSPYSALSAMAIDPMYISLRDVFDFQIIGGERTLSPSQKHRLEAARASARVDYGRVRALKVEALRAAFGRFREADWIPQSVRARQLHDYIEREAWWIRDYSLYRSLLDRSGGKSWQEWPQALACRDERALESARTELADECLFHSYVQWVAEGQWQEARRIAAPVAVVGDVSFMVAKSSADVWTHQHAFRLDATVGAPPDAFSSTGQDWGLPAYRWDVFAAEGDAWIRMRAKRYAALFDGCRLDHLVGFYRTFVIPGDGSDPAFSPAVERDQLAQGERVLRVFLESGTRIIAEDLGVVPDFVRESLLRLGVAGFKVFRWEREWEAAGQPFRNPENYPTTSVTTTGTHDTETLVSWWEGATVEERALVQQIPLLSSRPSTSSTPPATGRRETASSKRLWLRHRIW